MNSLYLGNFRHGNERLLPPDASMGPVDGQRIRTWLRAKYVDKSWHKGEVLNNSMNTLNGASIGHTTNQVQAVASPAPHPTVAKIPPSRPAPSHDLLGGTFATATTPSASDAAWDAFGSSRAQSVSFDSPSRSTNTNVGFQADFSQIGMSPPPVPPPQPPNSFQVNSKQMPNVAPQTGHFGLQAHFDEVSPPQTQQQASAFQVNFDQMPSTQPPSVPSTQPPSVPSTQPPSVPSTQPPTSQPPLQMQPQSFQANFDQNMSSIPPPLQEQQQMQMPAQPPFSNTTPTQEQHSLQQQPPFPSSLHFQQNHPTHIETPQIFNDTSSGPTSTSETTFSHPPTAHKSNNNSAVAFANFNGSAPVMPSTTINQTSLNGMGYNNTQVKPKLVGGHEGSQPHQMENPFTDISCEKSQTLEPQTQSPGGEVHETTTVTEMPDSMSNKAPDTSNILLEHSPQDSTLKLQGSGTEPLEKAIGSSSIMSLETHETSTFDAFNSLNMGEDSKSEHPSTVSSVETGGDGRQDIVAQPKYAVGQKVYYKDSRGDVSQAEILKVHLDDDLVPFYDIKMSNGREKQTDDGHLSLLDGPNCEPSAVIQSKTVAREEVKSVDSEILKDIVKTLEGMNSKELLMVKTFMKDLKSGELRKEEDETIQEIMANSQKETKNLSIQHKLNKGLKQHQEERQEETNNQQQQFIHHNQQIGQHHILNSQPPQLNQWNPHQQSYQARQYQQQQEQAYQSHYQQQQGQAHQSHYQQQQGQVHQSHYQQQPTYQTNQVQQHQPTSTAPGSNQSNFNLNESRI